jgi:hypothetical protein
MHCRQCVHRPLQPSPNSPCPLCYYCSAPRYMYMFASVCDVAVWYSLLCLLWCSAGVTGPRHTRKKTLQGSLQQTRRQQRGRCSVEFNVIVVQLVIVRLVISVLWFVVILCPNYVTEPGSVVTPFKSCVHVCQCIACCTVLALFMCILCQPASILLASICHYPVNDHV